MHRAWRAANRLIASEWCSRFLRRIYRITGNDVSKSSNDFANREIKGGGKLGNERVGEDDNSFPFLFSSTPKNAHFSRFHILFNYLLITLFLKIIYIRSNYFENKMEKKDILPEIDYSASIVIGFGEILIYAWTGLISINRGFYIGKFLTPFPTSWERMRLRASFLAVIDPPREERWSLLIVRIVVQFIS